MNQELLHVLNGKTGVNWKTDYVRVLTEGGVELSMVVTGLKFEGGGWSMSGHVFGAGDSETTVEILGKDVKSCHMVYGVVDDSPSRSQSTLTGGATVPEGVGSREQIVRQGRTTEPDEERSPGGAGGLAGSSGHQKNLLEAFESGGELTLEDLCSERGVRPGLEPLDVALREEMARKEESRASCSKVEPYPLWLEKGGGETSLEKLSRASSRLRLSSGKRKASKEGERALELGDSGDWGLRSRDMAQSQSLSSLMGAGGSLGGAVEREMDPGDVWKGWGRVRTASLHQEVCEATRVQQDALGPLVEKTVETLLPLGRVKSVRKTRGRGTEEAYVEYTAGERAKMRRVERTVMEGGDIRLKTVEELAMGIQKIAAEIDAGH